MAAAEPPDAHEVALRALRRRDLSRLELDQRLRRAGVDGGDREHVIERLTDAGLVSDERFARERARVLAARGVGDDAIRVDLKGKRVPAEAVDAALHALEPEAARAATHFARRGGGERALRYLARKGFSPDTLASLAGADELH